MSKSVRLLTRLNHDADKDVVNGGWGAMLCGVGLWLTIAYVTAWVAHDITGMTLNAYDWAEWTTLTPAERQSTPALMAGFWLRLHMVLLVLIFVGGASSLGWRKLGISIVVVGSLLQMPPPEFVANFQDINYQQQAMFALVSLVMGAGFVVVQPSSKWLGIIIGSVGLVACVAGLEAGLRVIAPFELDVSIGWGFGMMLVGYGLLWVVSVLSKLKRRL